MREDYFCQDVMNTEQMKAIHCCVQEKIASYWNVVGVAAAALFTYDGTVARTCNLKHHFDHHYMAHAYDDRPSHSFKYRF